MPAITPDLTGWTPVMVDSALAEIYVRVYVARSRALRLQDSAVKNRKWRTPAENATADVRASDAQTEAEAIEAEGEPFEAEFTRRGGWTRAFLVTSSTAGHVHTSRGCSTCRWTTEFIWLPEYSGAPEEQIVNDAGERACTTCYPSAPAEVRERATRIFSPQERDAAQARVEREALRVQRAAVAAAKAIWAPDGSPLKVEIYGVVKTERAAQTLYVERAADALAVERHLVPAPGRVIDWGVDLLLESLALKRGLSVDDMRALLAPKVEARVRRDFSAGRY